jgi:uroporphyrinogen III methyltransferase/synthase
MRVLVTRPHQKATDFAEALKSIGAEAIIFPCIEIVPVADTALLDRALSKLECYDWLVFTSANAVEIVSGRLSALGVEPAKGKPRIAAVGPQTAFSLGAQGLQPDFVPDEYLAEALLPGLGDLQGRWVLLPTADIADDYLPAAIQTANGIAHVITVYRTLPPNPDLKGFAELRAGVDVITFTSGSTVRNFITIAHQAGLDPHALPGNPRIACIGPKTAQVAEQMNFKVDILPENYTAEGLIAAIDDANQVS